MPDIEFCRFTAEVDWTYVNASPTGATYPGCATFTAKQGGSETLVDVGPPCGEGCGHE